MPRHERVDALILGGGVAGLSAALWLRGFDLTALILEEGLQPGGQLHEIHASIVDYLLGYGFDGARFAGGVLGDARSAGLSILVGAPVTNVSARAHAATRAGGTGATEPRKARGSKRRRAARAVERYSGRTLVIATGLRRRALGVPGEREFLGRGVSHSANRDRTRYTGRPVVVVGGGTAAVEDALLCAEIGSPVTLLHRSSRFRARDDFLERARKSPLIHIVTGARVTRIQGRDEVESVEYRPRGARKARDLEAAAVFVRIGWEPRTELVRRQVRVDRSGYIRVGPGGVTNVPGVYAAGDVCSPRWPSIANAAGQGAAVAWEIARKLGRVR